VEEEKDSYAVVLMITLQLKAIVRPTPITSYE
jgi:hypothetical protein